MKLIYTLRRQGHDGGPIRYDEATDMVVIASSAKAARQVAAANCRDEGPDVWLNGRRSGKPFARIKCIGFAKLNDNGSIKQDQVVVCDGCWAG